MFSISFIIRGPSCLDGLLQKNLFFSSAKFEVTRMANSLQQAKLNKTEKSKGQKVF